MLMCSALAAGCASKPAPVSTDAETTGATIPTRWSGSFKTSQMAASAVIGPATPGRAAGYGTISLTSVATTPASTRVELSVSAPVAPGSQVAWALFTGPCGSPSPPIAGPNEFPRIDVANNGAGNVRTVMAITLDPRTSYHANVYWSAQVSDVSNVMMCANVTLAGAR